MSKTQTLTAGPGGQPANNHNKVQIPRINLPQISICILDVASNGSHNADEKGKRLSLIIKKCLLKSIKILQLIIFVRPHKLTLQTFVTFTLHLSK